MAATAHKEHQMERVNTLLGYVDSAKQFLEDVLEAVKFLMAQGFRKGMARAGEEIRFLFKHFTLFDVFCGSLSFAALAGSVLTALSGFGILAYQCFVWLRDGVWNALPLMELFNFLFEDTALQQWMNEPDTWLGLHQLVEWILTNIPVSLVLIVVGTGVSVFMVGLIVTAILVRRFQFKHREQ